MIFYRLIKSVINKELSVKPINDIATNNCFNLKNENLFDNCDIYKKNNENIEDFIINKKRKRDFFNKKNKDESNLNVANNDTLLYITEMYKQSKSYEETVKDKTFLNVNVLSNDFLNKTQKDLFFKVYSKSIKYLKSLNYFVRKLKQNKALQYEVDCDLFLNSFHQ